MTIKKHKRKKITSASILRIIIWIFAILVALLPVIWMFSISLIPQAATMKFPPNFSNITFNNYKAVFVEPFFMGFPQAILNSIIVSFSSTLIVIILGLLAAYGFSKFNFPFKRGLFMGVLIGRMFPLVSLLIPIYLVLNQLKLINTKTGLIIAHVVIFLPLMIWFLKGYMQSLPQEVIDSARIDGCGEVNIIFKIIAPLALPGVIGMGILIFVFSWGEFFFASALMSSPSVVTFPVRLNVQISSMTMLYWGPIMAYSLIASAIPITLGLIFQRQIVSGLTAGAIK